MQELFSFNLMRITQKRNRYKFYFWLPPLPKMSNALLDNRQQKDNNLFVVLDIHFTCKTPTFLGHNSIFTLYAIFKQHTKQNSCQYHSIDCQLSIYVYLVATVLFIYSISILEQINFYMFSLISGSLSHQHTCSTGKQIASTVFSFFLSEQVLRQIS